MIPEKGPVSEKELCPTGTGQHTDLGVTRGCKRAWRYTKKINNLASNNISLESHKKTQYARTLYEKVQKFELSHIDVQR